MKAMTKTILIISFVGILILSSLYIVNNKKTVTMDPVNTNDSVSIYPKIKMYPNNSDISEISLKPEINATTARFTSLDDPEIIKEWYIKQLIQDGWGYRRDYDLYGVRFSSVSFGDEPVLSLDINIDKSGDESTVIIRYSVKGPM